MRVKIDMKTALILGGTSGIGNGIALELTRRNIALHIVGRDQHGTAAQMPECNFIQVDLTSADSINSVLEKLANTQLDYVVFCAATETPLKPFSEITENEYDYALNLNLKVPFLLTRALVPKLNNGARILFLTSRLSSAPEVGSLVYCMTKSAIEIFSAGLNKEFGGKIFASSVIPGVVDTDMQRRLREADPLLFPKSAEYQKMQPRLLSTKLVSECIVAHLCDTDNAEFSVQRVNPLRELSEKPKERVAEFAIEN